jgi:hypothetical protein
VLSDHRSAGDAQAQNWSRISKPGTPGDNRAVPCARGAGRDRQKGWKRFYLYTLPVEVSEAFLFNDDPYWTTGNILCFRPITIQVLKCESAHFI